MVAILLRFGLGRHDLRIDIALGSKSLSFFRFRIVLEGGFQVSDGSLGGGKSILCSNRIRRNILSSGIERGNAGFNNARLGNFSGFGSRSSIFGKAEGCGKCANGKQVLHLHYLAPPFFTSLSRMLW